MEFITDDLSTLFAAQRRLDEAKDAADRAIARVNGESDEVKRLLNSTSTTVDAVLLMRHWLEVGGHKYDEMTDFMTEFIKRLGGEEETAD